jgi:hypothetical protein
MLQYPILLVDMSNVKRVNQELSLTKGRGKFSLSVKCSTTRESRYHTGMNIPNIVYGRGDRHAYRLQGGCTKGRK